jgi:hypothetical protein
VDLFDRLRRDIGKVPWGAVASVFIDEIHSRADSAGDVVEQVQQWGTALLTNAVRVWPGNLAHQVVCESPDVRGGKRRLCRNLSIVVCDVCGRRCCLEHVRIDYYAGAICEPCIGEAKARQRAKVKATGAARDVRELLRVLRLKPGATWEEVRAQYRKLAFKYSADRPQTARMREKNTERLKALNLAFEGLRKHFEAKEAA